MLAANQGTGWSFKVQLSQVRVSNLEAAIRARQGLSELPLDILVQCLPSSSGSNTTSSSASGLRPMDGLPTLRCILRFAFDGKVQDFPLSPHNRRHTGSSGTEGSKDDGDGGDDDHDHDGGGSPVRVRPVRQSSLLTAEPSYSAFVYRIHSESEESLAATLRQRYATLQVLLLGPASMAAFSAGGSVASLPGQPSTTTMGSSTFDKGATDGLVLAVLGSATASLYELLVADRNPRRIYCFDLAEPGASRSSSNPGTFPSPTTAAALTPFDPRHSSPPLSIHSDDFDYAEKNQSGRDGEGEGNDTNSDDEDQREEVARRLDDGRNDDHPLRERAATGDSGSVAAARLSRLSAVICMDEVATVSIGFSSLIASRVHSPSFGGEGPAWQYRLRYRLVTASTPAAAVVDGSTAPPLPPQADASPAARPRGVSTTGTPIWRRSAPAPLRQVPELFSPVGDGRTERIATSGSHASAAAAASAAGDVEFRTEAGGLPPFTVKATRRGLTQQRLLFTLVRVRSAAEMTALRDGQQEGGGPAIEEEVVLHYYEVPLARLMTSLISDKSLETLPFAAPAGLHAMSPFPLLPSGAAYPLAFASPPHLADAHESALSGLVQVSNVPCFSQRMRRPLEDPAGREEAATPTPSPDDAVSLDAEALDDVAAPTPTPTPKSDAFSPTDQSSPFKVPPLPNTALPFSGLRRRLTAVEDDEHLRSGHDFNPPHVPHTARVRSIHPLIVDVPSPPPGAGHSPEDSYQGPGPSPLMKRVEHDPNTVSGSIAASQATMTVPPTPASPAHLAFGVMDTSVNRSPVMVSPMYTGPVAAAFFAAGGGARFSAALQRYPTDDLSAAGMTPMGFSSEMSFPQGMRHHGASDGPRLSNGSGGAASLPPSPSVEPAPPLPRERGSGKTSAAAASGGGRGGSPHVPVSERDTEIYPQSSLAEDLPSSLPNRLIETAAQGFRIPPGPTVIGGGRGPGLTSPLSAVCGSSGGRDVSSRSASPTQSTDGPYPLARLPASSSLYDPNGTPRESPRGLSITSSSYSAKESPARQALPANGGWEQRPLCPLWYAPGLFESAGPGEADRRAAGQLAATHRDLLAAYETQCERAQLAAEALRRLDLEHGRDDDTREFSGMEEGDEGNEAAPEDVPALSASMRYLAVRAEQLDGDIAAHQTRLGAISEQMDDNTETYKASRRGLDGSARAAEEGMTALAEVEADLTALLADAEAQLGETLAAKARADEETRSAQSALAERERTLAILADQLRESVSRHGESRPSGGGGGSSPAVTGGVRWDSSSAPSWSALVPVARPEDSDDPTSPPAHAPYLAPSPPNGRRGDDYGRSPVPAFSYSRLAAAAAAATTTDLYRRLSLPAGSTGSADHNSIGASSRDWRHFIASPVAGKSFAQVSPHPYEGYHRRPSDLRPSTALASPYSPPPSSDPAGRYARLPGSAPRDSGGPAPAYRLPASNLNVHNGSVRAEAWSAPLRESHAQDRFYGSATPVGSDDSLLALTSAASRPNSGGSGYYCRDEGPHVQRTPVPPLPRASSSHRRPSIPPSPSLSARESPHRPQQQQQQPWGTALDTSSAESPAIVQVELEALLEALEEGDAALATHLLRTKPHLLTARGSSSSSINLLHCACSAPQGPVPSVVECILGTRPELIHGVDALSGNTALHFACAAARPSVAAVKLLLMAGAAADARNMEGYTAFHVALLNRSDLPLNKLKDTLLALSSSSGGGAVQHVDERTARGQTPLHLVCGSDGNVPLVRYLLARGADAWARAPYVNPVAGGRVHEVTPVEQSREAGALAVAIMLEKAALDIDAGGAYRR